MRVCEKAYRYVVRKRGKSILLGSVFAISLLVALIGQMLLASFEMSLREIGKQSKSQITVFSNQTGQVLTNEKIRQLALIKNIDFVNRTTEAVTKVKHLEIGVGSNELIEDAKVMLQGFDDLTKDSLFARQITQIGAVKLELKEGEIFIHETLAAVNGIAIDDVVVFYTEQGKEKEGIVKGIYSYMDPNVENEDRTTSLYRLENLIFANIEWVQEFQIEEGYIGAHFYIENPYIISDTRLELAKELKGSGFETGVIDATFRRMSQPLLQTESIIKMILNISIVTTIIITFLLLSLWAKERKREVALLVSIGESRTSIIGQRIWEGLFIYGVALVVALVLANILIPYISSGLYLSKLESLNQIKTTMGLVDSLLIGVVGFAMIAVAVMGACMSILRFGPRAVFSAID